mmetsp:Transcript_61950/g.183012  ORF Transcript_61950/g.183012 Transcript_61950/m.183012 type:complete len:251 (+) Transcript_61950:2050-2802(+)
MARSHMSTSQGTARESKTSSAISWRTVAVDLRTITSTSWRARVMTPRSWSWWAKSRCAQSTGPNEHAVTLALVDLDAARRCTTARNRLPAWALCPSSPLSFSDDALLGWWTAPGADDAPSSPFPWDLSFSSSDAPVHPGLLIVLQFKTMSFSKLPALPSSLMGAALPPATELAASSSFSLISASTSRTSHRREMTSPRRRAAGGEDGSARKVRVRCRTSPTAWRDDSKGDWELSGPDATAVLVPVALPVA